jgi:hypothetical protein
MTAVEMHHSFNMKVRAKNPEFFIESYEVEKLFNEAQDVFIDKYRPTVDTDEISRKKLDVLIDTDSITPAATASDNISTYAVFVTMPIDLRDILFEKAVISGVSVKVKPIKYDEYHANIDNPFKKPYTSLIWRLDYGSGKHELISSSGSTITSYFLRYIKEPTTISIASNTTPDLHSRDHEELVNIAISILENRIV